VALPGRLVAFSCSNIRLIILTVPRIPLTYYEYRIRRTMAQLVEKYREYSREEDNDTCTRTDNAAAARSFLPIVAVTIERPLFPRQDSAVMYELIHDRELAHFLASLEEVVSALL
jgi:hypothetical protein